MIVVDTNVIAYLLLPGEQTAVTEQVMMKESWWIAPVLWQSEFRNILALYLRREKLTWSQAQMIIAKADNLMKRRSYHVSSRDVLSLVKKSSCSAYDCEFVALAQRFHTSLVTADRQILRDFPETAVSLQDFANS